MSEFIEALQKAKGANELNILRNVIDKSAMEKARTVGQLGETRTWGGKEYIKTAKGWRPKPKGGSKEGSGALEEKKVPGAPKNFHFVGASDEGWPKGSSNIHHALDVMGGPKYSDPSKVSLDYDDEYGWSVSYDGKEVGHLSKNAISKEDAKAAGWYKEGQDSAKGDAKGPANDKSQKEPAVKNPAEKKQDLEKVGDGSTIEVRNRQTGNIVATYTKENGKWQGVDGMRGKHPISSDRVMDAVNSYGHGYVVTTDLKDSADSIGSDKKDDTKKEEGSSIEGGKKNSKDSSESGEKKKKLTVKEQDSQNISKVQDILKRAGIESSDIKVHRWNEGRRTYNYTQGGVNPYRISLDNDGKFTFSRGTDSIKGDVNNESDVKKVEVYVKGNSILDKMRSSLGGNQGDMSSLIKELQGLL